MNKLLAALLALMLVLSGCLGDADVIDNDEDTKPVLLDTDGDGTPDIDDDDDDGDSWSDVDELNCNSDSLSWPRVSPRTSITTVRATCATMMRTATAG